MSRVLYVHVAVRVCVSGRSRARPGMARHVMAWHGIALSKDDGWIMG